MTAGYQCGSDLEATHTADEDVMPQSGERDFYRYTLAVPLVSAPGERLFYCSAEPNLAGGLLERIAGEPQVELFDRIAFTGGSYSMPSLFIAQRVYVSQYLLPAVRP